MQDDAPISGPGSEASDGGRLDEAAEEVLDFIEGLLGAMGLEAAAEVEKLPPAQINVSIQGQDGDILIGRKGRTLDALQDLARAVVQRQVGFGVRLALDVEGYRDRRRQVVERSAWEKIEEAVAEGEAELEPMTAQERKWVHDLVAKNAGVSSFSEGLEPDRRVVIRRTDQP